MSTIAKASLKYVWPSWIVYDQNFRQEAAHSGLKDWAHVNPSIYTQCFTGMTISQEGWCSLCQSIDHGTDNCPLRQVRKRPAPAGFTPITKRQQPEQVEVCRKFNRYNGDCKFGKACRFKHACSACGGPHPISQCPNPRKREQQRL